MMDKGQFLYRDDDIALPRVWEDMRLRQRERDWPFYVMNCQMANCANSIELSGNLQLMGAYNPLSGSLPGISLGTSYGER